MAAGKHDIYIEQGSNFSLTLTIKDTANAPLDLTGHTFRGKIRKTPSDPTVVAEFTFTVLDQTQTATKGKVTVSLTATTTAGIAADPSPNARRSITNYSYDIESEIGGVVTRWLEGLAKLSPEVTK